MGAFYSSEDGPSGFLEEVKMGEGKRLRYAKDRATWSLPGKEIYKFQYIQIVYPALTAIVQQNNHKIMILFINCVTSFQDVNNNI